MKHRGTSANSGHYIAEAMDWTTGLWFEFNDEDVTFLEMGPKHSIEKGFSSDSTTSNGPSCKNSTTTGSSDAYSLFYAERSYLGQQAAQKIISQLQNESNNVTNELFSWIKQERTKHEQQVTE